MLITLVKCVFLTSTCFSWPDTLNARYLRFLACLSYCWGVQKVQLLYELWNAYFIFISGPLLYVFYWYCLHLSLSKLRNISSQVNLEYFNHSFFKLHAQVPFCFLNVTRVNFPIWSIIEHDLYALHNSKLKKPEVAWVSGCKDGF